MTIEEYCVRDAAVAQRATALLRVRSAQLALLPSTGKSYHYWRRELRRRQRTYNLIKALTFCGLYGSAGSFTAGEQP
jgi:hypothetical protein